MKKTFKRVIALVAALALTAALVLTGCSPSRSVSGTPHLTKAYFEKHTAEVLKNSLDPAALFPVTENPFAVFLSDPDAISALFSLDLSALAGVPAEFAFSVASDKAANRGALRLDLTSYGTVLDAAFYVDNNKLMLASDTFFGEGNAYSLTIEDFDTMLKKFEESNFAKVLGIPTETVKDFCEQYGINNDYLKKAAAAIESMEKDAEKLKADYEQRCTTLLESYYGEISEGKITLNGKTCDTLALDVTVNDELLAKIFEIYMDYTRESQSLTLNAYRTLLPEAIAAEMLSELENSSAAMDELQDSIDLLLDMLSVNGTYTYYLAKDTGYLVQCHAELDLAMDGENAALTLDMYFENGIHFTGVATNPDGESINIGGSLTFTGTDAALIVEGESTTDPTDSYRLEIGFKADKDAGTYRVYATTNEWGETTELFEMNGNLTYTADSFDMTVANIRSDGEDLPLDLRFAVNAGASVTLPENCSELLDLSENEVYTLVGRVTAAASQLAPLMMGDTNGSLYSAPSYEDNDEDLIPMDSFVPLTYDDYDEFADYYTYEEFCEFVDTYNELFADYVGNNA